MNWTEQKGVVFGGAITAAVLFPAALFFCWEGWTTHNTLQEDRKQLLSHEIRLITAQQDLKKYTDFLKKTERFFYEVSRLGLQPNQWEPLEVALDKQELPWPKIEEILHQAVPGLKHLFVPKLLELAAPPPELSEEEKKTLVKLPSAKAEVKHALPILTLHGTFIARKGVP